MPAKQSKSKSWAKRLRYNSGPDSFVPWGLIGGDRAQSPAPAPDGNMADRTTRGMKDKFGMVFNGDPSEDDIVGYTRDDLREYLSDKTVALDEAASAMSVLDAITIHYRETNRIERTLR